MLCDCRKPGRASSAYVRIGHTPCRLSCPFSIPPFSVSSSPLPRRLPFPIISVYFFILPQEGVCGDLIFQNPVSSFPSASILLHDGTDARRASGLFVDPPSRLGTGICIPEVNRVCHGISGCSSSPPFYDRHVFSLFNGSSYLFIPPDIFSSFVVFSPI